MFAAMVSLPDSPKSAPSDGPDAAWKPRSTLLGTLLANRYRITGAIGQGSTGAVFRADDVLLHRPVAIRILVPSLAHQPQLISQIRSRIEQNSARDQEALVNLVDITDVGMTLEGEVFIATDFLDGDHLSTMLARGGRLPWSRARTLVIRLGQILHGFHRQGIVAGTLEARHCYAVRSKVKAEAIKIVHNAILEHLAGAIGPGGGHGVAMLARYVAPERICGEPLDARTDVYSLGVIAYELLTGSPPFVDTNPIRLVSMHLQKPPPSPRSVAPDARIPEAVEALLLKCLAKDPKDRFPDMEALTEALAAIPETATDAATAAAPPLPTPAANIPLPAVPTPAAPLQAPATSTPLPAPPLQAPAASTPLPAVPAPAAPLQTPLASAPLPAAPAAASPISVLAAASRPVPAAPPTAPPVIPSVPSPAAGPGRPHTMPLGSSTGLTESGKLRLPPPPTLGGAPRGVSGPVPVSLPGRPPTLGLAAALPPPPSLPPVPTPVARPASIPVPSATLPPGSIPRPAAHSAPVPSATSPLTAATGTPVPSDTSPAGVPVPSATRAASTPVPAAILSAAAIAAPVPPASAPVPSATQPPPAEPVPSASSTDAAPVPSAILATAESAVKPEEDPVKLRSRIAAFAADEARRRNPLRNIPASAIAETRIGPAPTRPIVDDEPARPATPPRPAAVIVAAPDPRPIVDDEPARPNKPASSPLTQAAPRLQVVPASPPEPALTDALDDEPPRRRGWLVGGIVTLVAAAGVAALVLTSPSFLASRTADPTTPTKIAAPIGDIPERANVTPTKIAEAQIPPAPDRGAAVVDPPADTTPPPADDPKPADTTPTADTTPPAAAVIAPDTTPDTPAPTKKNQTKKRRRSYEPEDEEPREKDIFDQVREHMEAKKAAEAARLAAMQGGSASPPPTPAPQPAPAEKTDADKARETLERARQASSNGNPSLAYSLARQAYNLGKSLDALELMGVAACKAKMEDNARFALGSLTGTRRNAVKIACTQSGITL